MCADLECDEEYAKCKRKIEKYKQLMRDAAIDVVQDWLGSTVFVAREIVDLTIEIDNLR